MADVSGLVPPLVPSIHPSTCAASHISPPAPHDPHAFSCANRPCTTLATILRAYRYPTFPPHGSPVQGWVTYDGEEDSGAVIFNSLKHPSEYEKKYE